MDDDLQEIRHRKDRRNAELDKLMSEDGKEKENQKEENALHDDTGVHRTVVRHSFKKTPKDESAGVVSATSTPASSTSVKALRSRWELSSVTGTPLHPDNDDEIIMAAVKLSQQRRNNFERPPSSGAPRTPLNQGTPFRRFEKDDLVANKKSLFRHYGGSPLTTKDAPPAPSINTELARQSPRRDTSSLSSSEALESPRHPNKSSSQSSDSPQATIEHEPSPTRIHLPATSSVSAFTTTATDEVFRPVTPNDQIIGSLWDDINAELEKYKQSKQYQSDPDLSPRSHYGSSFVEAGHSISAYRSQSAKRTGQPNTGQEVGTSNASLESMLPEKRQKAEISVEDKVNIPSSDTHAQQSHSQVDEVDSSLHQKSLLNTTAEQEAILKHLHDTIIVQQDQICQASRALAFCRQNDKFRGSREEVDAQRALLISTERRRALLLERDRVINGRNLPSGIDPKGTLTFSAISIKLSREYINNYVQHTSTTSRYYFIVLIKCGEHVFHTTLATSDQGIKSGYIEFSHYITISDLSPDFVCEIEFYSLKANQDHGLLDRSARSKKGTWRRMVISTPINTYSNTFSAYSSTSAHRPIGVMDPGFQRVGHLSITRQLIHRQKFLLTDSTYPLEGSVLLTMDCHPDPNAMPLREYRSFLSLYQIVSGLGSWTRFWCTLGGGQLRFWRYPEDEANKTPCVTLDLYKCVSQVTPVPLSTASFPNSMHVDVIVVNEQTNQKDGISMLFAADTPEEREHWMECINQSIRKSNVWRMVKRK